jgi:hypothetical protein
VGWLYAERRQSTSAPFGAHRVLRGGQRKTGRFWYFLTVVSGPLPVGTVLAHAVASRAPVDDDRTDGVPDPDSYAHAVDRLILRAESNGWTIVDDVRGSAQNGSTPTQAVPVAKVARIVEMPPSNASGIFRYTLCSVSGDRRSGLAVCHSLAHQAREPGVDGAVTPDSSEWQRALADLVQWAARHSWTIHSDVTTLPPQRTWRRRWRKDVEAPDQCGTAGEVGDG